MSGLRSPDRPIRKPVLMTGLILDRHVRYVGDPVAIVAGRDEACVDQALKRLKVEYEILPAILDLHEAKDSEILVHPEENWKALCKVGGG